MRNIHTDPKINSSGIIYYVVNSELRTKFKYKFFYYPEEISSTLEN